MIDALYRAAYRIAWSLLQLAFRFVHPHLEGTAVLVRMGDEVLLVRNSYRKTYGPPGGLRRRGADAAHEAARELREEVGLEVSPDVLVDRGRLEVDHSYACDHVHFFELRVESAPPLHVDRREVVWAGFHRVDALGELPIWKPLEVFFERERAQSHRAPTTEEP